MAKQKPSTSRASRWAERRFSVVGPLLAAPPEPGELAAELKRLSKRYWQHPVTGERRRFGFSTIERWYYQAKNNVDDPVGALRREPRRDLGTFPSLSEKTRAALRELYDTHKTWSYQLHFDNLVVLAKDAKRELGPLPCYDTVRRFMQASGLIKQRRPPKAHRNVAEQVLLASFDPCEVRSYEAEYVGSLWHVDGHQGSLKVLVPDGRWLYPVLIANLDDCSRLCCHAQWYLTEDAEDVAHTHHQAFLKRGLPWGMLSDNGKANVAAEVDGGLRLLSITPDTTLPYSPYQNGKQEAFWGQVEGRLLPMLEGVKDLTLAQLNEATLAWVELEYNRKEHDETNEKPIERFLRHKSVLRPPPTAERLHYAFTQKSARSQRRSDGTISLFGIRYEIPDRYRTLQRIDIRFTRWDRRRVYLIDAARDVALCRLYPLDKQNNADGRRRRRANLPQSTEPPAAPKVSSMAPLLADLVAQMRSTGLPPAYLPKNERHKGKNAPPPDADEPGIDSDNGDKGPSTHDEDE